MNHQLTLNRVGEQLGLPLEFDQSNQCMLMFDRHLLVSLAPEEEHWKLTCMLARIEPEQEKTTFKKALLINHHLNQVGSGHIYFEDDSHALLYLDRIEDLENTDEVIDRLTELINRYEYLQGIFESNEWSDEDFTLLRGSNHVY
ncbi:chaperone SicP [Vibrio hepatarius]|uniref:chaperone SicP n=1 Tax=Vibrio hepatarius TaxID=171383 RepID=UPI001C0989DE|nr:chaperone SicP [Vibrio hepatarius]MBU2898908.1 chaperone SicP [Vibrio hepatarius]